ncbi:MAG: YIP1 family protein [Rhodospirillales bacterium]|nr:YIP1 family protein [Rhodospirillales bacterium]
MRYPNAKDHYGPAGAPLNPWLSVWFRPRKTVRYLLNTKPSYGLFTLVLLLGFAVGLSFTESIHLGDRIDSLRSIIVFALISGPPLAWLSLFLSAYMLRWIGRKGEGEGKANNLKALMVACAWGGIPLLPPALVMIQRISANGVFLFTEAFTIADWSTFPQDVLILEISNAFVNLVCLIWSLILTSQMIAEVQGYESAWKGFRNYLLALILVIISVIVLAFMIIIPLALLGAALRR